MSTQMVPSEAEETPANLTAAWVIGVYLVLEVGILGYVGVIFWLASEVNQVLFLPLRPSFFELFWPAVTPDKFAHLRQLVLAGCLAGTGGSVFMIRQFYIRFAYGERYEGVKTYLKNREIPRFVLLPFSATILGPISIFLLQAGAIVFAGFSPDKTIPDYTVVTVSFLFGFSYHDSLDKLSELSRKMLGGKKEEDKKEEDKKEGSKKQEPVTTQ